MARDEDPLIHRSVHLEGSWFPLVAGFSLVITGRIWCLHAGWEQAEVLVCQLYLSSFTFI